MQDHGEKVQTDIDMEDINIHEKPIGNIPKKDWDYTMRQPMTMFLFDMEINFHPIRIKQNKRFQNDYGIPPLNSIPKID
jgi:hypothetical protein